MMNKQDAMSMNNLTNNKTNINNQYTTNKTKSIELYNKKNHSTQLLLNNNFVLHTGKEPQNSFILPKKWIIEARGHTFGKKDKNSSYTEKCQIKSMRLTRNQVYSAIILDIFKPISCSYVELNKFGLPERTFKRYLKELEQKKWIMRIRGAGRQYALNPFLQYMLEHWHFNFSILDYACYKIDFHKLLSYPLRLIKNPVKFTCKDCWQKIPLGKGKTLLKSDPKMHPVFYGFFWIHAEMPNGLTVQTILPINFHYNPIKNRYMKEAIIYPHYTLPCDWSIFNVKEVTQYTGFSESINMKISVHFDNSIKVPYSMNFAQYWMFNRPYEKAVEKWDGAEYIEFAQIDSMKKLFTLRFKEGYTRKQLFEKMGLELKPKQHRPKREKRKYTVKKEDPWEIIKKYNF